MSDNSAATLDPSEPRDHPSSRRLRLASSGVAFDPLEAYGAHLARSPLSPATRAAYRRHVAGFLRWLADQKSEGAADALSDSFSRDFAVRDYRAALKDRLAPASVNAMLAAIDHFYGFVGLGAPRVNRDVLPSQAPRALSNDELRRLFRAAERRGSPRDRAVLALMALAGLRVSEVAGLDVGDVAVSARKGCVRIRHGKGDSSREVPLGTEARELIAPLCSGRPTDAPLVTADGGRRLSVRSLDRVIRGLGRDVEIELSSHVLRHTFVTRLVRSGADIVVVAELAGHRSLETTRRYALPTAEDRAQAVELASVESDY